MEAFGGSKMIAEVEDDLRRMPAEDALDIGGKLGQQVAARIALQRTEDIVRRSTKRPLMLRIICVRKSLGECDT